MASSYRDPLLGRLDHHDDLGFDDPERPTAQDCADLEPPRAPDEARFTRVWDPATRFAWQTSPASRAYAHRQARIARLAARPDPRRAA